MENETMRVGFDYSAYYEAKAKLPKPDGKHCIICGTDLPKGQRKYCSHICYWSWLDKIGLKDWSKTRWQAFERDNFTCRKCGVQHLPKYAQDGKYILEPPDLIGDHIKPIFLGGSEFDLENVQTLCILCSKEKTRQEAKTRTKIENQIRLKGQRRLVFEETKP
jgi:5-methylcytosine-specific restriction endonuclease McrA